MQIVCLIWGILAFCGMVLALLPLLGALNWLNVPFSAVGFIISIVVVSTSNAQRKGPAIAGLVLCALGIFLGIVRLIAGSGIV